MALMVVNWGVFKRPADLTATTLPWSPITIQGSGARNLSAARPRLVGRQCVLLCRTW